MPIEIVIMLSLFVWCLSPSIKDIKYDLKYYNNLKKENEYNGDKNENNRNKER